MHTHTHTHTHIHTDTHTHTPAKTTAAIMLALVQVDFWFAIPNNLHYLTFEKYTTHTQTHTHTHTPHTPQKTLIIWKKYWNSLKLYFFSTVINI